MTTVALTVQDMSRTGLSVTRTAAGASPLLNLTDTFQFKNTGKEFLHFKKSGLGQCVVSILIPRTVDGLAISARLVILPASTADMMIGPFPPGIYNTPDTETFAGFTLTNDVTGLTVAIVRMP